MLQQTQVERVLPYYRAWLKRFPSIRKLAEAPLGDVLRAWQGLGYNRRAKMLREAARSVVDEHKGRMPRNVEELEKLPGVGPYTARAVAAFAYNSNEVFIETNIRTAALHHFYSNSTETVHDKKILSILAKTLPKGRACDWYGALMDYGAYLKRSGVRLNQRSKGYTKQSSFKGSEREARGAVLRNLSEGPKTMMSLLKILGAERSKQVQSQLVKLEKEGFVEKKGTRYFLAA